MTITSKGFADDLEGLCRMHAWVVRWMRLHGMRLNAGKTQVVGVAAGGEDG